MFSAHKLINYSTEPADSFTLAMYIDFDLGCYRDDYIGCHPATNTVFGYNRTNTDLAAASCDGVLSFGDNPPVQAVTFLNKGLDYFIPIFNASVGNPPAATTDPTLPNQYHLTDNAQYQYKTSPANRADSLW